MLPIFSEIQQRLIHQTRPSAARRLTPARPDEVQKTAQPM